MIYIYIYKYAKRTQTRTRTRTVASTTSYHKLIRHAQTHFQIISFSNSFAFSDKVILAIQFLIGIALSVCVISAHSAPRQSEHRTKHRVGRKDRGRDRDRERERVKTSFSIPCAVCAAVFLETTESASFFYRHRHRSARSARRGRARSPRREWNGSRPQSALRIAFRSAF
jgi:hypothetical protein